MRKLIPDQYSKNKYQWSVATNRTSMSLSPRLKDCCGRRARNTVKRLKIARVKQHLLGMAGPLIYELTVAVVTCIIPVQGQSNQYSSTGGDELWRLYPHLRAIESWWFLEEEESVFFKGVAPARMITLQGMAPHRYVHGHHKLDLSFFFFKGTKL